MKCRLILPALSIACIALTLTMSTMTVHAQFPGPPPGGGPMQRNVSAIDIPSDILSSELTLTEKQQTKIDSISKKLKSDLDALRPSPQDGPPDWDKMRANFAKMRTLREAAEEKIKAVLTEKQNKQLTSLEKNLKVLRSVQIPIALYSKLDLSETQLTKLSKLAAENQSAMKDIFTKARDSGSFDSIRSSMEELNNKTSEKVKSILTDKQNTLLEDYLKEHPQNQFGHPGGFGGGQGGPGGGFGGPPPGDGGDAGGPPDGMGPPPGGGPDGPPGDMGPPPGDFSASSGSIQNREIGSFPGDLDVFNSVIQ